MEVGMLARKPDAVAFLPTHHNKSYLPDKPGQRDWPVIQYDTLRVSQPPLWQAP